MASIPNPHDLSTFAVPAGFRGRSALTVQLWWLVQALLFNPSPQVLYGWRAALLRLFGAEVGRATKIRPSVKITYPWKLRIGDFAWVGDDVTLYSLGPIDIGAHAVVSQKSYLCTGTHDPASRSFAIQSRPIVIGPAAWVATDVFVAPGVTIGAGTVVAARSSVWSDLPPNTICKGSPAVVVRARVIERD